MNKTDAVIIGAAPVGLIAIFIVYQYNDTIFFWIQKAIPQLNDQSKALIIPLFCSGFFWHY